ncbi:Zn-dependent hydrolase [Solirubrobacter soli]|uniref:Zn-dependent hydrolase n=1 Tax=Solirubrobacter soli TaxID=363832 RepID=UPI0003FF8BF0|nr:Zn-dependent hydrolase [Solirubrobacter soli]
MPSSFEQAARRVLARADELATYTEEPGRITRPVATRAMALARARVREWMQLAGLETRVDAVGNLAGRREGPGGLLALGSHLDTVADAGRYDGMLGILVGIEVAERAERKLDVVAFADEDGLRFNSRYLGSRAFIGELSDADLALRDAQGLTLREAIGDELGVPLYDPATRAYFEVHIEQGPVLEAEGLALGVVTAIAGQSHAQLAFTGRAGHAGTTPMHLRRDALAAAAEFVLAVEQTGLDEDGLVATVGQLDVPRGASNVIPGQVDLSLDVRHQDDAVRAAALARLRTAGEEIARLRAVSMAWSDMSEPSTPCTPALVDGVAGAVRETGVRVRRLPSGAGHDTVTMARVTDTAMLFVRCAGGISHHPDESVTVEDVSLAIEAATRFVCST